MKAVKQPRVLLLTATLGYGGAEADLIRLARYLASRVPVTIAVMARDYGSGDYSSAQTDVDLPVVVLGDTRYKLPPILAKGLRWWSMLRRLRGLKRRHDVTISFLSGPNLLNALAGRRFPSIVSERGSKLQHVGISARSKWLWLRVLDPLTYFFAGRIVPASIAYAEEVSAIAGPQLMKKVVAIEGGIDASALIAATDAAVDADIESFCAAPTLVYCSRLDDGKGIDLLLPVFARVKRQHRAARLLVIGDGPLRSKLLSICAVNRLLVTDVGNPEADVFLAGYRSDPMRHFRLCHTFCFPSLHEGLPNALIEGIASGIPVLAADCLYGPRSILTGAGERAHSAVEPVLPLDLSYGTLMPMINSPEGPRVWEQRLIAELSKPKQRASPDFRTKAIARFDLEQTGKQWLELVYELAEKRL